MTNTNDNGHNNQNDQINNVSVNGNNSGNKSPVRQNKRRSISDTTEIQSKVQQELLRQRQEQLIASKEISSQNSGGGNSGGGGNGGGCYTKNRSQTMQYNQNSKHDRNTPPPGAFISSTRSGRSKSPVGHPVGNNIRPLATKQGSPIVHNKKGGASLPRQRPNRLSFYVDPFYVGSIQVRVIDPPCVSSTSLLSLFISHFICLTYSLSHFLSLSLSLFSNSLSPIHSFFLSLLSYFSSILIHHHLYI